MHLHIMYDVAASGSKLPFQDNVVTAVLGYAVVFAGLLILMGIVYAMGAIFKARAKKEAEALPEVAAVGPGVVRPTPAMPLPKTAPGTAGEVKLFDVPDKEAAMIMAIVADQMGKPLNELRFTSIKAVKKDEV